MLALWRRESRPLANGLAYLNRGSTTRLVASVMSVPVRYGSRQAKLPTQVFATRSQRQFDGAATHKISVLAFSEYWGYGDARIRNVCFSH